VVGVQPIFGAIDSIAAHSDRYSSRCSCTRRTARSRTSGENLLFLLMAPFSQEMKPPQNPGRFRKDLPIMFPRPVFFVMMNNLQRRSLSEPIHVSAHLLVMK